MAAELLYHAVFMSLPNLATIFSAIGLFCSLYPPREPAARRLAVVALSCAGLSLASAMVHRVALPAAQQACGDVAQLMTPAFFTLVLLACLPLARHAFELGIWDALFCCASGYALQNFAHALYETGCVVAFGGRLPTGPLGALLQLALTAGVFAAGYLAVIRHMRINHLAGEGDRRMTVMLACVIVVNIFVDNAINGFQTSSTISTPAFLVMRATQLLASVLLLSLDYEILYSNRMRADAAATRQMMDDQRRQYELSRDTIEAINVRCHDIRHQVRRLSDGTGSGREFLEGVSDLISIYDAGMQTGNEALDVILTEKSLLCQSRGIELTCTCDGRALSFMEEQDVYSLFGNALDNAIEAVEGLSDPNRRLIDVSARQVGRTVSVQVRNFYEGELRFEGGLPQTTHEGGLHGYGMRSLRLVAERYGGSLSTSAEDGIFRLFVLLPRES